MDGWGVIGFWYGPQTNAGRTRRRFGARRPTSGMDLGRLAFRSLLLLAVAALVAGCASQPPAESGDVNDGTLPANETTGETPGCIQSGQTGSGDGDIAADRACPDAVGDDNSTGSLP